jgi:hypothetical protein
LYVLSGLIRSNGEGWVALTPLYFGFGGESCSAVAPAAISLPGFMIGFHVGQPHCEPLLLPVTPPADAAVLALQFGASEGATLDSTPWHYVDDGDFCLGESMGCSGLSVL